MIKVPRTAVRPTQDKVREALFSILGDRIHGARFLDLYAGSGAVGLEAWSRGAEFVCWIENDRKAHSRLVENVRDLCDHGTRVLAGGVVALLKRGVDSESAFDIVFADPPYEKVMSEECGVRNLLIAVGEGGVLKDGGLFILEKAARGEVSVPQGWKLVDERSYGRTKLCFFGKECK